MGHPSRAKNALCCRGSIDYVRGTRAGRVSFAGAERAGRAGQIGKLGALGLEVVGVNGEVPRRRPGCPSAAAAPAKSAVRALC